MSTKMLSASTMKGQNVYNREGEHLGHIAEIMIDLQKGAVGYVVLSFGGIMGVGDKLFAIPYEDLTPNAERKCFFLQLAKDSLEDAPGFDKHHWPTNCDEVFEPNLHGQMGLQA